MIVWTVLGEFPQSASETVKNKGGDFPLKESKIQDEAIWAYMAT